MSFPEFFLEDGRNRGFIGTETLISDGFASRFARVFYARLLKRDSVGMALHKAKWALLRGAHNPLGLFYTLYANPELNVRLRRPVRRPARSVANPQRN